MLQFVPSNVRLISQDKILDTFVFQHILPMKNIFTGLAFFLFFVLSQNRLQAQSDSIVYTNGTRQAAKIIEVNKKVVRFKNPKDTLGPTFSVNIKNIERFVLKGDCIDLKTQGYLNCAKDPAFGVIKNEDFTKNIISIDALQLTNSHIQVSYEHIFKSRAYGVVGYFNHGFSNGTDSATYGRLECKINGGAYYKNDYAGFDFKFYPYLHKKTTFWVALGIESGIASNMLIDYHSKTAAYQYGAMYYTDLRNPFAYYETQLYIGYHVSSGFLYRINKHFICQGNISLGVSQFTQDPDPDPLVKSSKYAYYIKASAGVLLGYAF
ncbi:MAG TPA: hypothetical protein VK835_13795 [Bacteroidia bacterium]|nr:hypothetical protein [Bacteroidia bacterium]